MSIAHVSRQRSARRVRAPRSLESITIGGSFEITVLRNERLNRIDTAACVADWVATPCSMRDD